MSEEPRKATVATRARRKRQKARQIARISELESQLRRTLQVAALALERCEVATDPSGAADEAASLLRQVVTLDGSYVPKDAVMGLSRSEIDPPYGASS